MISDSSKSALLASLSRISFTKNHEQKHPFAIQGPFPTLEPKNGTFPIISPLKTWRRPSRRLPQPRNNAESRLDSWVFNLRPWVQWTVKNRFPCMGGPVLKMNTGSYNIPFMAEIRQTHQLRVVGSLSHLQGFIPRCCRISEASTVVCVIVGRTLKHLSLTFNRTYFVCV